MITIDQKGVLVNFLFIGYFQYIDQQRRPKYPFPIFIKTLFVLGDVTSNVRKKSY
jgi:hypothetical protein